MKRIVLILTIFCFASAAFASFKIKNVKAKKPEQFQSRITIAGVTYAADLLLNGDDQITYFQKELTPSNLIAVRLAIFNNGQDEVILPMDGLQLLGPDGKEMPLVGPEKVAQAVLQGTATDAQAKPKAPQVQAGAGSGDPRSDPADPRYDPRLDPNSPSYDPNDPRNRGQYPPGSYPGGRTPGTYPSGSRRGRPGVILNPGGGGKGDLSKIERQLAEKDFNDKAHTSDPVPRSTNRDRFLYFSMPAQPVAKKGYILRLPVSKGIPQEVILKF